MPVSTTAANELRSLIDDNLKATARGGEAAIAGLSFCGVWPTAKPILETIAGIAFLIPGVGAKAAAILTALIAAGQAIYEKTCQTT